MLHLYLYYIFYGTVYVLTAINIPTDFYPGAMLKP